MSRGAFFLILSVIFFPANLNGSFCFQLVCNVVAVKNIVGFRIFVGLIYGTKQAVHHKSVNVFLNFRKSISLACECFGNDSVMLVAVHSAVVDHSFIKVKPLCGEPVRTFRIFGDSCNSINNANYRVFHILGNIIAVRSRIGQKAFFV